jgi:hypothetical protein
MHGIIRASRVTYDYVRQERIMSQPHDDSGQLNSKDVLSDGSCSKIELHLPYMQGRY